MKYTKECDSKGGPRSWTAQVEVDKDSASAALEWVSLLSLGLPSSTLAESACQVELGRGEKETLQVTATSAWFITCVPFFCSVFLPILVTVL